MLVHCYVGRSRSATLVLAYLIARRRMTLRDALQLLRTVRPQARPNPGFYRELVELEASVFGLQVDEKAADDAVQLQI